MRTISRNLLIIVCKPAIFSLRLLPQFLACAAKFGKLGQLLLKFSNREKPGEKSFKIGYIMSHSIQDNTLMITIGKWVKRPTHYQGKCIQKSGMFGHTYVILYFDPHILCSLIERCGFKVARSCYNCCPVLVVESFVVGSYWFFT